MSRSCQLEQRLERLRRGRHRAPTDRPTRPPAPGTVGDRELVGRDRLELVPARTASTPGRPRRGAHAPRAEHRLVGRVLVEVDEHARAPLLLPPGGGDQVGPAPLQLPRERHRRGPDGDTSPTAARAARRRGCRFGRWSSGSPVMPSSSSSAPRLGGGLAHHREGDAGRRVEVDAQLVGVVGVGGVVRPHVEAEAAQVHRPGEVGDVGDHQRVATACRWASAPSSSAASRARSRARASGRTTCRRRRSG